LKALDHLVLSSVVGPSLAPARTSSQSASAAACGLSAYLDSDNVTAYEDDFDLLLWWCNHKLTYPILSIMARDIMSIFVSTVSLESWFSLTGRIIEEYRQCLLPRNCGDAGLHEGLGVRRKKVTACR
jgi:hypothetical protein